MSSSNIPLLSRAVAENKAQLGIGRSESAIRGLTLILHPGPGHGFVVIAIFLRERPSEYAFLDPMRSHCIQVNPSCHSVLCRKHCLVLHTSQVTTGLLSGL
jgi:hypothetical protein